MKTKLIKILVVAAILAYPATLEADTIPLTPSSTASSTVTVPTILLEVPKAQSIVAKSAPTKPKLAVAAIALAQTVDDSPVNGRTVAVTAYASVPGETDDTPFITASGAHVADGIIAANFLPFGTKVQIPSLFGDKIFTVEDRTAPRFGGRIDIWMPTVEAAVAFGLHRAQIFVLDSAVALQ